MKISSTRSLRPGFTLVELLVVIMIVATLATIGTIATRSAFKAADATKAKKVCGDLVLAVENFRIDHNGMFPLDSFSEGTGDEKIRTDVDNSMMAILVNKEKGTVDKVNQAGKSYFSCQEVDGKVGGMYVRGDQVGVYDPWRLPYLVVLDTNLDDKVEDPTTQREVSKKVIVFSAGPDGKFGDEVTNSDNVYSYK